MGAPSRGPTIGGPNSSPIRSRPMGARWRGEGWTERDWNSRTTGDVLLGTLRTWPECLSQSNRSSFTRIGGIGACLPDHPPALLRLSFLLWPEKRRRVEGAHEEQGHVWGGYWHLPGRRGTFQHGNLSRLPKLSSDLQTWCVCPHPSSRICVYLLHLGCSCSHFFWIIH